MALCSQVCLTLKGRLSFQSRHSEGFQTLIAVSQRCEVISTIGVELGMGGQQFLWRKGSTKEMQRADRENTTAHGWSCPQDVSSESVWFERGSETKTTWSGIETLGPTSIQRVTRHKNTPVSFRGQNTTYSPEKADPPGKQCTQSLWSTQFWVWVKSDDFTPNYSWLPETLSLWWLKMQTFTQSMALFHLRFCSRVRWAKLFKNKWKPPVQLAAHHSLNSRCKTNSRASVGIQNLPSQGFRTKTAKHFTLLSYKFTTADTKSKYQHIIWLEMEPEARNWSHKGQTPCNGPTVVQFLSPDAPCKLMRQFCDFLFKLS